MSIADVKREIATWSARDQEALASYLTALRLNRDDDFRQELRELKSDEGPANWMSLEDAKRRLADS